MSKLIKLFKIAGLGIAVLLGGAFAASFVFEDELKTYAFEQIESQLISKMDIKSSNFSFIDKFPKASLELKDVWIEDPVSEGDTLIFAKHVYLAFSPWNIFRGNYSVERIDVEDAYVNMIQDENGNDNFHFWKSSPDTTGSFSFDLSQVKVQNTHYIYSNLASNVNIDFQVDGLNVKAEFSDKQTSLTFKGDAFSNFLKLGSLSGLSNEALGLEGSMRILGDGDQLYFDDVNLELEAGGLTWGGSVLVAEEGVIIDGNFAVEGGDVGRFNRSFPDLLSEVFKEYQLSANIDAKGSIKGKTFADQIPEIKASIQLSNGGFMHKQSGEKLSDIETEADLVVYSDKTFSLATPEIIAEFRHGELKCSGTVENKKGPFIDAAVQGSVRLAELKSFFALDTLETFEGDVDFLAKWKGPLPDWKTTVESMKLTELSGNAKIDDASVKLKGSSREMHNVEGNLLLNGTTIAVQELKGMLGESDFKIEGFIKNFLPYLTDKDETLFLEASFYSEKLQLDQLLNESSEVEATQTQAFKLDVPAHISCNLNVEIEELLFKDFKAENVKGVARLAEAHLKLNPVSFTSSEGEFLADLSLVPAGPGHYKLLCEASIKNIEIAKFFKSLNSFGQDVITDKHIKGRADADISFKSDLDELLFMDRDKIYSLIDITIKQGELIGLESLAGISEYLRENKLISGFVEVDEFDKKLKHIRFSELSNTIEIENQEIRFPKMEIASSAMGISAYGKHSFNNEIDYSITFRIRDVLRKKNSEFGEVEDDGLGSKFFLAMTGTTSDPEFSFDRDAAKAQRKENRDEQKQEFKDLLKEEFGIFGKKDKASESEPKEQPKKDVKITVDWGESTDSTSKKIEEPKEKKKKSWLERLKEEEETEAPPPLDDDDDF